MAVATARVARVAPVLKPSNKGKSNAATFYNHRDNIIFILLLQTKLNEGASNAFKQEHIHKKQIVKTKQRTAHTYISNFGATISRKDDDDDDEE